MYNNIVVNIFNKPRNTGRISKPDGIANCYNFNNTAHVEFSLRIDGGMIKDCKFRAQANPYIIAVCSLITEMVKGKMCSDVFVDPYSIQKELGFESIDIMFCIDCLLMAIEDAKEKLGMDFEQESIIDESAEQKDEENNNSNKTPIYDSDDDGDFIEGLFDDEFFEED